MRRWLNRLAVVPLFLLAALLAAAGIGLLTTCEYQWAVHHDDPRYEKGLNSQIVQVELQPAGILIATQRLREPTPPGLELTREVRTRWRCGVPATAVPARAWLSGHAESSVLMLDAGVTFNRRELLVPFFPPLAVAGSLAIVWLSRRQWRRRAGFPVQVGSGPSRGVMMRTILRWAWSAAATLSLLLFALACAGWARSYWAKDNVIGWAGEGRYLSAASCYGGLYVEWGREIRAAGPSYHWMAYS